VPLVIQRIRQGLIYLLASRGGALGTACEQFSAKGFAFDRRAVAVQQAGIEQQLHHLGDTGRRLWRSTVTSGRWA